jgi:hypothetical protein
MEIRGEIKSLMVNWRLSCINPSSKINVKKRLNSRVEIEVRKGYNCIKLKVLS